MLKDFKRVIELSDKLYKSNINIKNNGKLSFIELFLAELEIKITDVKLTRIDKENYKVAKQSYLRKTVKYNI